MAKTVGGVIVPSTNSCFIVVPAFVTPAGGGTGASWSSGLSIAEAVDKNNTISGGVIIFLKEGSHDVTTTLTLRNGTTVYGGFAGTEATPAERVGNAFVEHVSKLDGKGAHQIMTVEAAANFDRVTFANGKSGGNGGGI